MTTPTEPGSLAEHVDRLLVVETAADTIRAWHPALIPGILQTEAYAAAAIRGSAPALTDDMVESLAWARTRRIDTLGRAPGRRARIVIGEAALHRPVGGPQALAEQLRHLLDVAALRPSLDLRVLPAKRDEHPALAGAFSLYEGDRRSVFVETLMGGVVIDRPERALVYRDACDHAEDQAADPAASLRIIQRARKRLAARA